MPLKKIPSILMADICVLGYLCSIVRFDVYRIFDSCSRSIDYSRIEVT